MITAFISGKVVSHNRDRRPIKIFNTNDSKTIFKNLHQVVKLIFITHVLEAVGSP